MGMAERMEQEHERKIERFEWQHWNREQHL
jgi:hypothetical protein